MLKAWCQYHYNPSLSTNQLLWLNSNVKVGNKVLCWKNAIQKGLMYTGQLCRLGGFVDADEIYD